MDGRGIRCVNSNACAGFIDISRGLNKQLQMGECGTAMTHVLGKVDKLIVKSFQHWQNAHTPQTLESCLLLQDTKGISLTSVAAVVTSGRRMAFPDMHFSICEMMV